MLHAILSRLIRQGSLTIRHPDGSLRRYQGAPGPSAGLAFLTGRAERRFVLDPGLSLGESYMDGEVEPLDGSIHDVLDLLLLNLCQAGGNHPLEHAMELWRTAKRRLDQFNPAGRARRNAAHHYDLDARLFRLFLDRDMQYSCAYFPTGQETLEQAQQLKLRHIAAKLRLDRPGLEVLEIGCGWGGLALFLAREYGARVTALTLSTEQLEVARARAAAEGVALVHSIGRAHGPGATNPWLAKYIFPGGYSPALSEVLPAVEKSGLWMTDIEILRLHYAQTIAHWRRRFAGNRDAIGSLYDERFCRMFEFYLSGCELAFRRMGHMNWQLQLAHLPDAVPLTRDYIAAVEAVGQPAAE